MLNILSKKLITIYAAFLLINAQLYAADNLTIEPTVSVGAGYSDNLEKESEKESIEEKSSYISEVSPGLLISKKGSHVQGNLNYKLNSFAYSNKDLDKKTQVNHNLTANLDSKINEVLFLDLKANITQELIDKTKIDTRQSNKTGVDNLTETYSFNINPRWEQRWGGLLKTNLSFNYNQLAFDNSSTDIPTNDSKQKQAQLSIMNGDDFRRLTWNLSGSFSQTDYENELTPSSEVTLANFLIAYQFNDLIQLNAQIGYEEYNQDIDNQDNNTEDDDGVNSNIGFVWTPSHKNKLGVSVGNRFYGKTYQYFYQFQGDRAKIKFEYNESITNSRDQLLSGTNNNNDLSTQLINQTTTNLFLSKRINAEYVYSFKHIEVILNSYNEKRSFSKLSQDEVVIGEKASIRLNNKKSVYKLSANYEDRDIPVESQFGRTYGADLSWDLKIGKRTNSNLLLSWTKQNNNLNKQLENIYLYEIDWSLKRRLSKELNGEISLTRQKIKSSNIAESYIENVIFINLSKTF
ncbi:MAG: TIGR03016 family PEP-CTERM system-associated outer membrane protein [Gammaproteobacteria bacterium]|nr:TIGR03016 family PEP-CTERM system-associated outer membrane protein [Gammaproteobacteria bacterium]